MRNASWVRIPPPAPFGIYGINYQRRQ